MFKKIAVTISDSPESTNALDAAIGLAKIHNSALLTVSVLGNPPAYTSYATVVDPLMREEMMTSIRDLQSLVHQHVQARASEYGISVESHIVEGHEVKAIVDLLREANADLLIIGLRHRSFFLSCLWSAAYYLAQQAPCSILGVH
jgi:nucleotide-binding universal stress UspA family protein